MTQNPFDALGGRRLRHERPAPAGPADAGAAQSAQAELADTTVEGTVAGGAVTVTVNGVGELVGVDITRRRLRRPATPTTSPTSAT